MQPRTISKLAKETGVGVQTIRFYEREGLLEQPTRPETGWRTYDNRAVKLVHFIKRAQALGFSLADIRELFALESSADPETCEVMQARVSAKVVEIDAKIRDLEAMRTSLQGLLEAARGGGSCSNSKVAGTGSLTTPTAWNRVFGALPAITVALLPKVACPACWPAYAGLLSSVGLGFLLQNRYLLPLTVVFLSGALVTLGWRARQRRGFGPLLMGGLAAAVILAAKFYFESDAAMYVGVAGLIGASVWNSWPRKRTASCPACVNV